MASKETVEKIFHNQLKVRAKKQLKRAGELWKDVTMNFFFPENQNTVDIFVRKVLKNALKADGTVMDPVTKKRVPDLIDTDTKVSKAICIVHLATFQPVNTS